MRAGCFSSDFYNGSGLRGGVNNDERITTQLCRTLVEATKRMVYKERGKKREGHWEMCGKYSCHLNKTEGGIAASSNWQ